MRKIIKYTKENKSFLLGLFIFSWVLTFKNKIGVSNTWKEFVFHPDAPFWLFLNAFIIFSFIDYLKRRTERNRAHQAPSQRRYFIFFAIGFFCYLLFQNIFGVLISLVFDNFSRNFNSSYQITYKVFNQAIDFILFGGLSLTYLYAKENRNYRKRLNDFEVSDSKSKIEQLQSQLNPHFLFNNLNVLDQLIEEDQEKASDFLGKFSEVYRYALRSSDKQLIPIQEELRFVQNYFELMEEKYKGYYQLIIRDSIKTSNTMVPPFCLQVLVENAIVHNLGTTETPVIITITLENKIIATNNKVKLYRKKKSNGVALKNLSKQFQLLTNKAIDIQETEEAFSVSLPLIKMHHND